MVYESFVKTVNRIGPNADPCGTSHHGGCFDDLFSQILTDLVLASEPIGHQYPG